MTFCIFERETGKIQSISPDKPQESHLDFAILTDQEFTDFLSGTKSIAYFKIASKDSETNQGVLESTLPPPPELPPT